MHYMFGSHPKPLFDNINFSDLVFNFSFIMCLLDIDHHREPWSGKNSIGLDYKNKLGVRSSKRSCKDSCRVQCSQSASRECEILQRASRQERCCMHLRFWVITPIKPGSRHCPIGRVQGPGARTEQEAISAG